VDNLSRSREEPIPKRSVLGDQGYEKLRILKRIIFPAITRKPAILVEITKTGYDRPYRKDIMMKDSHVVADVIHVGIHIMKNIPPKRR